MEKGLLVLFQPKVSIVIPVYNGANYLSKAIDSALAQTYSNIEILVINDGSNDNGATHDIALSYDDKILYYEKENGGVSTALNLGIEKMIGEYFSWLSHDDEYSPDKIQKQVDFLAKKRQKNIILFSDYAWIDSDDHINGESILPYIRRMTGLKAVFYAYISGCTLLIPKICFEEVGKFDENLPVTQDYDLWFRFAQKYQFEHMPMTLVKSRLHAEQTTHSYSYRDKECNDLYIDFLNKVTSKDIKIIERFEIVFYIKLLIRMENMKYRIVEQFLYENKLNTQSIFLVRTVYTFYKKIYTCWYKKISLFCIFFNPIWTYRKGINYIKYNLFYKIK